MTREQWYEFMRQSVVEFISFEDSSPEAWPKVRAEFFKFIEEADEITEIYNNDNKS